jgi:hypothetical protein
VLSRLRGIDMARCVAIIGMVMVHIGPQDLTGGGFVGAAYRSSHGRSAILFIVLAGIGVSLLSGWSARGAGSDAGDLRPNTPRPGTTARLWWRALILLPAGLMLQSLPTNVAVILQYYAVAASSATLGPVVLVWLQQTAPTLFQPGVPEWNDVARIARDILVTGYYPVIVWTAPLSIGIWLGRRGLRDVDIAGQLLVGGASAAAAGFLLSDALVGAFGTAASDADWRQLAMIEPHNEMPLWVLTATGIAVAIVGCCLLLAHALPRVVWPLTAFGQLAFSVYVLHILVLGVQPEWLVRDDFIPAWISVARFTVISVALATAYRAMASRGPFELLLHAPRQRPEMR